MSANHPIDKRMPVWLVWGLLVGASLIGFTLAESHFTAHLAASVAITLAAAKINLVFGQYMDVHWSHRRLRLLLSAWLVVATSILLVGYWLA